MLSPSGSRVPALENRTVNGGAVAEVGVAETCTIGVYWPPRTKSIRDSCASGSSAKNPSPYSSVYSAPSGPNSASIGLSWTMFGSALSGPPNRCSMSASRPPLGRFSSNTLK